MFWFEFGHADDGRDIAHEISLRMWPSLSITLPSFLIGLAVCLTFALILAFFRATYVDFLGVVLCVTAMSISGLFYIIGGQWLISKLWHLVPISGFGYGFDIWRFAILPDRHRRAGRDGRGDPPVSDIVPGGDQQGLRAHRARQGHVRRARAVPACPAQRPHSRVDRCGGRHPEPVHRQSGLRVLLRNSRASAATPSTRSSNRTFWSCARWFFSARCSTSSA